MADIKTNCPHCGQECVFSEYVDPAARVCTGCGKVLPLQAAASEKRLRLKDQETHAQTDLTGQDLGEAPLQTEDLAAEARARRAETKPKRSSRSVGGLVFILLLALVIGIQYLVSGLGARFLASPQAPAWLTALAPDGWLNGYLAARWALLALGFLFVLYEAALDSHFKVLLCLIVPFYLIFYALASLQSFWRQSVFLVAVIMLATEAYFLPKHSMVLHFEAWFNRQVVSVSDQIDRAGEAPETHR